MYKGNFIVTSEGDEYPVGVLREANYANAEEIIAHLEIMLSEHHDEDITITSEFVFSRFSNTAASLAYTATSQNDFDENDQPYKWNGTVEMSHVSIYDNDYFESSLN
tara:strand:- start:166 stop:486 length:321 start_codon:yes stop_codon:yes gene_type:complete